ncbi:MAG TPA: PQQ-dependent sugar dehydrogenase [Candidatus Bathyarchaeia archaeon]
MYKRIVTISVLLLLIIATMVLVFAEKQKCQAVSLLASPQQYQVEVAFPNLSFQSPVGIYNAGDGSNRLFVVEQSGVIRVFSNSREVAAANVFLNISDRVLFGGEQGLLGLAFHPNFSDNGYFYVDYVTGNPRRTVIARYSLTLGNPDMADGNSEQILLEIEQPFSNHKGGQIAFGPDGYLYIALGDGGSGGDPLSNGQNLSTLLGKILRIDVDAPSGDLNYSIPSDNPFVDNTQGHREEIYAYGFRNPWRFSFDPQTGELWVGDVGQGRIEEIDIVENGKNYGWNIMEGSLCFNPPEGCNQTGLELPIWNYTHDFGISITGGFVYRGSKLPELIGAYIYGDYGSGRIWALTYDGSNAINTDILDTGLLIPSFGIDEENELYICAFDGKIYQLSEQLAAVVSLHLFGSSSSGWGLSQNNITIPGPTITVTKEDIVNLTLTSVDFITHAFFVDYNGNRNPNTGEPRSPNFQAATINYQFTANVTGTYTYYCVFHTGTMFGTFIVQGGSLATDINGDGIVDIVDITIVATAFDSALGDPKYNAQADLDDNGVIDILDITMVAIDFGKTA